MPSVGRSQIKEARLFGEEEVLWPVLADIESLGEEP